MVCSTGFPSAPLRSAPKRDAAANPSRGVRLGRCRGSRATALPAAPLRRLRALPRRPVLLLLRLFAVRLGVDGWWPPPGGGAAAALCALQRRSRLLFEAQLLRPLVYLNMLCHLSQPGSRSLPVNISPESWPISKNFYGSPRHHLTHTGQKDFVCSHPGCGSYGHLLTDSRWLWRRSHGSWSLYHLPLLPVSSNPQTVSSGVILGGICEGHSPECREGT